MMDLQGLRLAALDNSTTDNIEPEAFYARIQKHRANVKALALAVWERFHRDFEGLRADALHAYLDLHDAPKAYDLATLRELGYRGQETFLERLRPLFGVSLSDIDTAASASFVGLIQELNDLERDQKRRFLDSLGVAPHVRRQLAALEIAADVADTRLSPSRREELAIPWHAPGPAEYLSQVMGREDIAPYAEWLELRYDAIVGSVV